MWSLFYHFNLAHVLIFPAVSLGQTLKPNLVFAENPLYLVKVPLKSPGPNKLQMLFSAMQLCCCVYGCECEE